MSWYNEGISILCVRVHASRCVLKVQPCSYIIYSLVYTILVYIILFILYTLYYIYSFLTLLISSYEEELAQQVKSCETAEGGGQQGREGGSGLGNVSSPSSAGIGGGGGAQQQPMLEALTQHCLWAAGCVDSTAARLGLLVHIHIVLHILYSIARLCITVLFI